MTQHPPDSEVFAIGVDVGATKIAAALVSAAGRVHHSRQVPTAPERGPSSVLDSITTLVEALRAQAPAAPLGVGIGTPGRVDAAAGIVYNAVNLGWDEVHLAAEIRARLPVDLPIWLQKDANAAALGEYYFGAAKDCHDFVYVSIGSGLGAGVLAGGTLITGANWNAAELGHVTLDPGGLACACGRRGCAETVVSGPGLLALAQRYLAEARHPTRLPAPAALTNEAILAAARAGDVLALAALAEVGRHLGLVMAACVAVLDPARIVIGGGLGLAAFDFLAPPARAALERLTLAAGAHQLAIVPSRLPSSAVGAASLVWYFTRHDAHRTGGTGGP